VINKDIIQTIRDKEMDRKDFLKYSGLALLSVVGLKTIATLLTQPEPKKLSESQNKSSRGFGGGKYGV
jgi:hypothetical protein